MLESTARRTRAVQSAVHRLTQDFAMLEPRPVRDVLGDSRQPALLSNTDQTERLVELTRSSWTNPSGVPRSTLQRVGYRLEDGKLRRDYWSALDRTLTAEPASAVLLDDVRSLSLRFLDQNLEWHEQWPPRRAAGPDVMRALPVAVEIKLELEDWGEIVRLVEIPG
jgi:general secretion pathway protein J